MLVESGFVRVGESEGREWTFTPSLGRIASLGTPHEIVALYAGLHGPKAAQEAAYVLACLCDQDDPFPLIGCQVRPGLWESGLMPPAQQIVIARHLMQHGICGKARPGASAGGGQFSQTFDATEYIAAARVHFGLSSADAEALSMTEFQTMFEMKYPQAKEKAREVPTREEYRERIRALEEKRGNQGR
ncbi:DUF6246 family protein [Roseateles sp.]|uniref:DUF6246 family protein n=1 Tax=Roseateles sp. TaxID=1971397 RepID=UPI0031E2CBF6